MRISDAAASLRTFCWHGGCGRPGAFLNGRFRTKPGLGPNRLESFGFFEAMPLNDLDGRVSAPQIGRIRPKRGSRRPSLPVSLKIELQVPSGRLCRRFGTVEVRPRPDFRRPLASRGQSIGGLRSARRTCPARTGFGRSGASGVRRNRLKKAIDGGNSRPYMASSPTGHGLLPSLVCVSYRSVTRLPRIKGKETRRLFDIVGLDEGTCGRRPRSATASGCRRSVKAKPFHGRIGAHASVGSTCLVTYPQYM